MMLKTLFKDVPARLASATKDKKGSAAVEFALVAPPFLALMMSTFEVGWFYFATSQIDSAAVESARIIRTGQVQKSGLTKEQFFAEVCPKVSAFGDCGDVLTVEVDTFPTFAALAADSSSVVCTNDEPEEISALSYNPGGENEIVRLRVCLLYKTINPTIGVNVSETADGKRRVYSSTIIRNEPYLKNNRNSSTTS
jgi:Flp pilus assembly protein TadG